MPQSEKNGRVHGEAEKVSIGICSYVEAHKVQQQIA
jgi:hypothetical protein